MRSFIETYTGVTFEPLDPKVDDIRIEDIAHALSQQCRYSGHCRYRYTVAEHSVRVAEYMREHCSQNTLWGLLHDASEAYLVDVPTPLKQQVAFSGYRAAEQQLMAAICNRFGLPRAEPTWVAIADKKLLATEARDLMHGDRDYWDIGVAPLPERIRPWAENVAEHEFLRLFRQLRG